MLVKSFFNPFSLVLLALATVAAVTDVLFDASDEQSLLTPVVLLAMWFVGGLVRYAYEDGAQKNFQRHMARSSKRLALKQTDGLWAYVEPASLRVGDVIRLGSGDICPVDAQFLSGDSLMISESSVTGESGLSARRLGETVVAGSTIVDGKACAQVLAEYAEAPARHRGSTANFSEGAKDICLVLVRVMLVVAPVAFMVRGIAMGDWGEAALFALSAAVGLVPEMLPVVTGVCLSGSARRLEQASVIVKDVNAMESLGGIDVICMDKTGTLTSDEASLEYFIDIVGNESLRTLELAYLECASHGRARNQLDEAVLRACGPGGMELRVQSCQDSFQSVAAEPFDHGAKYSGAKIMALPAVLDPLGFAEDVPAELTVVKGEVESVCRRCSWAEYKGRRLPMNEEGLAQALALADDMRSDGIKVLAVAYGLNAEGWEGLILCGFLAFFDAPKRSAKQAVDSLHDLGIQVKVLTGDSAAVAASVCGRLGIPCDQVLTGAQISAMEEHQLLQVVNDAAVFAELTPLQKAQVVSALRLNGKTVGYLGDGLNDLPAIQASDVGIVVDSAASEAKTVADVVLEQKDLAMVAQGVREGRKAFANATKYIRIASSSNFGNVCSVALASFFLPFLPATAGQLLLLNLVYDATCLTLTMDNVGAEETSRPRAWSGRGLSRFMATFGPVSTALDLLTFALLFFVVCPAACGGVFDALDAAGQKLFEATFQAGWLLECAWTQSLVILALRSRKAFERGNRPCKPLLVAVVAVMVAAALLMISPAAEALEMAAVPLWFLPVVGVECLAYLLLIALVKRGHLKCFGKLY